MRDAGCRKGRGEFCERHVVCDCERRHSTGETGLLTLSRYSSVTVRDRQQPAKPKGDKTPDSSGNSPRIHARDTHTRSTRRERGGRGGGGDRVVRVPSLYSTCVSVDGAAAIAALSTLRHERDYNSIRQTGGTGRQSVSQVYSRLKDREQSPECADTV